MKASAIAGSLFIVVATVVGVLFALGAYRWQVSAFPSPTAAAVTAPQSKATGNSSGASGGTQTGQGAPVVARAASEVKPPTAQQESTASTEAKPSAEPEVQAKAKASTEARASADSAPQPNAAASTSEPAGDSSGGSTPAASEKSAPFAPVAALGSAAPTQASATASATATLSPATTGNIQLGAQIFSQSCDFCHPGGGQGAGPAVRGATLASRFPQDDALRKIIRAGAGGMPGFPASRLSETQLDAVVAYLRSL